METKPLWLCVFGLNPFNFPPVLLTFSILILLVWSLSEIFEFLTFLLFKLKITSEIIKGLGITSSSS